MTERIGDWVVEGPIGSGGMGTVYRCHNALTPRIKAAVKIIRSDRPESFRERFLREVESLEALHHPAVVRVKGWGEQEGMLWLAMDLVEGTDLEDLLASRNLTVDEATRVFTDVASGLAHAHERSVVHRDVKPANILIVPDGSGRIVDFGIAVQDGRTRLTAAGSMTGTPAYMAPEVFGGKPVGEMLDIYALGQALYESLTGAMAFPQPEGLTTTQQLAHVVGQKMSAEPLDPGPEYPDHLRDIIRRATQPHPSRRIPNMRAFADAMQGGKLPPLEGASDTINLDFEAVQEAQAAQAAAPARAPRPTNPTAVPPAPPPPAKRRSGGFITGALGAAVVLLLGVIALAAIAGVVAFVFWPSTERDVRVAIEGIPVGTPTAVWVDAKRAEPEIGGTIWHRADSPVEPLSVQVISGEACDVEAWDGTDCLPCCTCASAEVPADNDTVSLAITPPTDTASVTLTTNEVPLPWTLRAASDTLAVVETGRGRWRATGPAGAHTMAVSAGVCPDSALDCGSDCPPGCSSQVVDVTLTCGEATTQSTQLRTPRRPLEPTPRPEPETDSDSETDTDAPSPDTEADTEPPAVDAPEPVVDTPDATPESDKPTAEPQSDKPTTQMTRPGTTPAPTPAPTPRPRWGSGGGGVPEIRVPGFTPEAGSLNGVSVLVRHRATDSESAAIAVSRLSRRGATVRSEAYDGPGAEAQWGKLYYRTVDYNSSATLASSTLREVGYLTRLQRDLGTGDDIVVFLDPQ